MIGVQHHEEVPDAETIEQLGQIARQLPKQFGASANGTRLVSGAAIVGEPVLIHDGFALIERDGARLANFQYAAPEQRERGETVDQRADIYALGLILNTPSSGIGVET